MMPLDPFDDDTTHHADACVAVGVAVLEALANGSIAVTVYPDGGGGYLVGTHDGEEDE